MLVDPRKTGFPPWASLFSSEKWGEKCTMKQKPSARPRVNAPEMVENGWLHGPVLTEHLLCRQGHCSHHLPEMSQTPGRGGGGTGSRFEHGTSESTSGSPQSQPWLQKGGPGPGCLLVGCCLPPPATLASSVGERRTTSPKGSLSSWRELGSQT